MSIDLAVHEGNQAFVDEDYSTALKAYERGISQGGGTEVLARSNRAAVYLKLNKAREALQDASASVKLHPSEVALYRKGVAAFKLDEFETALEAFRQGQEMLVVAKGASSSSSADTEHPRIYEYRKCIRKCEAELEVEEDIVEQDVGPPSKKPTQAVDSEGDGGRPRQVQSSAPAISSRTPVSTPPVHLRTKFQYYQSHEKITVAILEKGLKDTHVSVDVAERRLTVRYTDKDKGGILFDKPLYAEVKPDSTKTRFLASKLEVTMTKVSSADWPELERKKGLNETAVPSTVTSKTPDKSTASETEPRRGVARPYASNKDWDSVEKDLKRELDADKPEGEEALNNLFKQIYGNADEDTRRAMVKSFQTSGGTVLSTNWDEVGKADYEKERQAPKGMEWRTWEGRKLPQKEDDDN